MRAIEVGKCPVGPRIVRVLKIVGTGKARSLIQGTRPCIVNVEEIRAGKSLSHSDYHCIVGAVGTAFVPENAAELCRVVAASLLEVGKGCSWAVVSRVSIRNLR